MGRVGRGAANGDAKDGKEKCSRCDKSYPRSYLATHHKKMHVRSRLTCFACKEVFNSPEKLQDHSLLHGEAGEGKQGHCCELCGKRSGQRGGEGSPTGLLKLTSVTNSALNM